MILLAISESIDIETALGMMLLGATLGTVVTLLIIITQQRLKKQVLDVKINDNFHLNVLDQVNKQLIPFLPEFLERYDPKDARFLGNPIDLIIFDGLDKGDLKRIVFVETRSKSMQLNNRELMIRNIIQSKKVEWEILEKD
jgi:predicted Holliday junction resolvase-like endonuclease